jgi:two-component system KDP operon response regulator KdpE
MGPKILVVDDEAPVRRLLKIVLSREAYEVLSASSGGEALDLAVKHSPNLVILDLALPGLDGLAVCRELRSWSGAPILVVSGVGDEATKIAALDQGADDYLTKPFTAGELLARVRALLRRSVPGMGTQKSIRVGEIEVNMAQREVRIGGKPTRLTRTEFDIIAILAHNCDAVVNASTIIDSVWGSEYFAGTQTLRVHVAHLRKKLEPEPSAPRYIVTEPGVGYRLKGA